MPNERDAARVAEACKLAPVTTALLLVDHGSRRAEANEQLRCMADLVRHLAGRDAIVVHAHSELAPPDMAEGFATCAAAGATHVVVVPYFLFAGRHATEDIPRLARDAAEQVGVSHEVTGPLGVHAAIAGVVLERAGLNPRRSLPDDAPACSGSVEGCQAPYCSARHSA